ncbi:MAG: hypothetical protein RLZZ283_718 [Candidatus Parcubacteria bacterium]|jgi:hypothetical protein
MAQTGFKEGNSIRKDTIPLPVSRWHTIGERGIEEGKVVRHKDRTYSYLVHRVTERGMLVLREMGQEFGGKTVEPTSVTVIADGPFSEIG